MGSFDGVARFPPRLVLMGESIIVLNIVAPIDAVERNVFQEEKYVRFQFQFLPSSPSMNSRLREDQSSKK